MTHYTLKEISDGVCARFGMTMDQLRAANRSRRHARPRQVFMFLAREMTRQSLPQIGRYLCRYHTTIMYGQRAISALIASDPDMAISVQGCREVIAKRGSWKVAAAETLASIPLVQTRAA